MLVQFLDIAQIAIDPPLPLCQTVNREKSAPNHPGKPLHPGQRGKKVPQTILASLYTHPLRTSQYGNNTLQKAASLICVTSFVLMQLLNYPVYTCVYNYRKTRREINGFFYSSYR